MRPVAMLRLQAMRLTVLGACCSVCADLRAGLGVTGGGVAVACNTNNWGLAATRYGTAGPLPDCTSCGSFRVTSCSTVTDVAVKDACLDDLVASKNPATGGFTSESACKFLAGYGWVGGVAAACPTNTYSVGGSNSTCAECPTGLTTDGLTARTTVTACGKRGRAAPTFVGDLRCPYKSS